MVRVVIQKKIKNFNKVISVDGDKSLLFCEINDHYPLDHSFSFFWKAIFRLSPVYFVLFTADFLKTRLNVSWVNSSHSCVENFSHPCGRKLSSLCGFENLFHGHTSWQISHPNTQSAVWPLNSLGISSFN